MKTRERVLVSGGAIVLAGFISVLCARPAMSEPPGPSSGADRVANNILRAALAKGLPDGSAPSAFATTPIPTKEFPIASVSGGVMKTLFDWKLSDEALG